MLLRLVNPEDRPDLHDYKSKEEPSQRAENSNSCKYYKKTFRVWKNLLLITERNIQSHFNKNNFFN